MKKVWTSLLLILSAAFLLTACADGGQQEEDTGAEGGLPGELAQIPSDYFDETTYLGTSENPSAFKNVLDNAMAGGDMEPMIVVCPTYNNTSFMPSSGSLTTDGDYMASIVRESGHDWDDFFIFAASGTEDFAYSSFRRQIQAMEDVEDVFRTADNEAEGNLWFLVQEGGTHSGEYALQYFYNGMCWIWK